MSTVVVVVASRGLGRGLAHEHQRRGWRVIGTVRDGARIGAGSGGATFVSFDSTVAS